MKQRQTLSCPNCGTLIAVPEPASVAGLPREVVCSTCQLHINLGALPEPQPITIVDLEAQLAALVERGLASELPPDKLVHILSNALTFVAESICPDHHFYVEVYDLGVMGSVAGPRQFPDVADVLRRCSDRGYGGERKHN